MAEYLNKPFIEFLVNTIENPPDTGEEDRICDVFVPLILSYNQHFGGKTAIGNYFNVTDAQYKTQTT